MQRLVTPQPAPTIGWLDMITYRLFFWRWDKLLRQRPDLVSVIRGHLERWEKEVAG